MPDTDNNSNDGENNSRNNICSDGSSSSNSVGSLLHEAEKRTCQRGSREGNKLTLSICWLRRSGLSL